MRQAKFFYAGLIFFLFLSMLGINRSDAASVSELKQKLSYLESQLNQLQTQVRQLKVQITQTKAAIAQKTGSKTMSKTQPPTTDVLGKEWDEIESGISGMWTRRGNSNTWDARWNNGATAVLQISITHTRTDVYGEKVYDIQVVRNDNTGSSQGFSAVYSGELKSTHELLGRAPKNIEGTMVYNWPEKGWVNRTQPWKATITCW
jgi:hypothetical protein